MTQDQYDRLVIDSKDKHSCLLFEDESIPSTHIGLFVPSRAFTLQELKIYLASFGLTDIDIALVPIHKRPQKAPFGGYVVTIPLPQRAH
jgi:hypothetical protein